MGVKHAPDEVELLRTKFAKGKGNSDTTDSCRSPSSKCSLSSKGSTKGGSPSSMPRMRSNGGKGVGRPSEPYHRGTAVHQGRAMNPRHREPNRSPTGSRTSPSSLHRYLHTTMGDDPWFFAPTSGQCYHLQRNCRGLRNARIISRALSRGDKNRAILMYNLRPCRLCVPDPAATWRPASGTGTTRDDDVNDAPEEERAPLRSVD